MDNNHQYHRYISPIMVGSEGKVLKLTLKIHVKDDSFLIGMIPGGMLHIVIKDYGVAWFIPGVRFAIDMQPAALSLWNHESQVKNQ